MHICMELKKNIIDKQQKNRRMEKKYELIYNKIKC